MAIVDFVFALGAGEDDLVGVDDDDVVSAIDVRRVRGLVFALEAHGNDGGESPDDQPLGVDQDPLLFHRGRLGDIG